MNQQIFLFDNKLICGILKWHDKNNIYNIDMDDMLNIINSKIIFIYDDNIPYYNYNYKKINLFQYIYKLNMQNIDIIYKNGNKYDMRKSNIIIFHKYNNIIKNKYNIINYIQGHFISKGVDAGSIKNPLWKIKENNITQNTYYIMFCETNGTCKLDESSYQKILDYEKQNDCKITWYLQINGYIAGHITSDKVIFMHQLIMNCYGNGKGTKTISVDHIDMDPTNNMMENLRIATRDEQEQNSKGIKKGTKCARKHNAKSLPDGLTQAMMKKYVVYYNECYNKEQKLYREFFKIETHPKLDKIWISSKSNKISIMEKLAATNKVVDDLENDIYPESDNTLPKYITLKNEKDKMYLIFDKREDNKRFNNRMKLPDNYNMDEQLNIFKDKIKEKYDIII